MMNKWLQLVQSLAPMIIGVINPALLPLAPLITHGIQEAEGIPGASGTDKKNAALAIVADGINAVNTIKKSTVIDPNVVSTASDIIDDVIEAANQAHPKPATNQASPTV